MIIFGWKVRLAKRGGGTFQCPVCNAPRAYEHIAARNWFTLFFIPLIPLRDRGEFVRCSLCQVTLDPVVLQTRAIEQATFGPPVAMAPTPGSPLPPPSAN